MKILLVAMLVLLTSCESFPVVKGFSIEAGTGESDLTRSIGGNSARGSSNWFAGVLHFGWSDVEAEKREANRALAKLTYKRNGSLHVTQDEPEKKSDPKEEESKIPRALTEPPKDTHEALMLVIYLLVFAGFMGSLFLFGPRVVKLIKEVKSK